VTDTHQPDNDLSNQLRAIQDRLAAVEKKLDQLIEARDAQPRDYRPQGTGYNNRPQGTGYNPNAGYGNRPPRPYGQYNNNGRTRTARYEGQGPSNRPNNGYPQQGNRPQRPYGQHHQGGRPNKFQPRGRQQ